MIRKLNYILGSCRQQLHRLELGFSKAVASVGVWGLVAIFCWTPGCDRAKLEQADALAKQVQSKLFTSVLPEQIQSLDSAYASLQTNQEVTIAGRIYAESISPFDANESSFTVIELPKPGHNHDDPGDCPFCRRELRNAKFAIVKVVDDAGNPHPRPADQLLGLIKNQDIVVKGTTSTVGDTMVLHAQQLHVLSKENAQSLSKAFHPEPAEVNP